jgi:hypothetical protein
MTKSSRSSSTRYKNQLQQSMNVPNMGNTGCSLCYDRSIPTNLNAHVSERQTCADVHLQLALLRYDNALCAVGQAQYQDTCCPRKRKAPGLKTTAGVMVGAILVAFFFRKIASSTASRKNRRVKERGAAGRDDDSDESLPGPKSAGCHGSMSSAELEMPTSRYIEMEEPVAPINKSSSNSNSRSRSRGRPHSRPGPSASGVVSSSRPPSRSRGDRGVSDRKHNSRHPPRSSSRGKLGLPRSRSRSKSRERRRVAEQHYQERGSRQRDQHQRLRPLPLAFQDEDHSEDVEVASQAGGPDLIIPTQLV